MKSPFSKPKVAHHGQRNAFDLSRKALFTANVGQLLPFFCQEVQPGDHFEISENSFTRTQPCQSAAYVRMQEHREFFFVPYRYLWSYWQQFITQVNDYQSSLLTNHNGNDVPYQVPLLSLSRFIQTFLYDNKQGVFKGNDIDLAGASYGLNAYKLFNLLGYGSLNFSTKQEEGTLLIDETKYDNYIKNLATSTSDFGLNPFRILAYQKIFYDYYRKADWSANYPKFFNIDAYFSQSNQYLSYAIGSDYQGLFTLQYRPYKMDYFTSVRPSEYWYGNAQAGAEGVNNSFLGNLPIDASNRSISASVDNNNYYVGINPLSSTITSFDLRTLFALDKYLRTTAMAGKKYDDQILAHFGVKPSSEINHQVQLLGAMSTPLVIDGVTSMADTAQGSGTSATGAGVGKVFGNGIANGTNNSDKITFDAKEHGIIMGIYSVGIDSDYDATGINPFNVKRYRSDYYQPEFDELGPFNLRPEYIDLTSVTAYTSVPASFGLIDPYLEYKTCPDKVYGNFMSQNGSLKYWSAARSVIPARTDGASFSFKVSNLYIDPRILNNVFGVSSSLEDQLLVNDYTIVNAVRNMSTNGIPRL